MLQSSHTDGPRLDIEEIDELAEVFIRYRIRTLGITFGRFAETPPRTRTALVVQARERLRDWAACPPVSHGITIRLN